MSKINKLKANIKARWVAFLDNQMKKEWACGKVTSVRDYLTVLISRADSYYLDKMIEEAIGQITGEEKEFVRTMVQNVRTNYSTLPTILANRTDLPPQIYYRLVIKTAQKIYLNLSSLVAVQGMKTPVAQVFLMKYKPVEQEKPADDIEGVTEDSGLVVNAMRMMTLEIIAKAIEAKSRKLKASWTIEAAKDIKAMHGLNIEDEILDMVSDEIANEYLREAMNAIIEQCESYEVPGEDSKGLPFGVTINMAANEIARQTRRGAGNHVHVSPKVLEILVNSAKSVFAPAAGRKGTNSCYLAGTLNGTIRVYCNHLLEEKTVLLGYKGSNGQVDAGLIVAPYMPVLSTGVVLNLETYGPQMQFMTRYGFLFEDTNFYKVIKL